MTQWPTALCRNFSFSRAFLLPNSFSDSLLSDTWKNDTNCSRRLLVDVAAFPVALTMVIEGPRAAAVMVGRLWDQKNFAGEATASIGDWKSTANDEHLICHTAHKNGQKRGHDVRKWNQNGKWITKTGYERLTRTRKTFRSIDSTVSQLPTSFKRYAKLDTLPRC